MKLYQNKLKKHYFFRYRCSICPLSETQSPIDSLQSFERISCLKIIYSLISKPNLRLSKIICVLHTKSKKEKIDFRIKLGKINIHCISIQIPIQRIEKF